MPNAINAIPHERLKYLAEDEDEGIDDNDAIGLKFIEKYADGIWGDSVENTGAIKGRNWNEVKNHKTEINKDNFSDDKIAETANIKENAREIANQEGDECDKKIRKRTSGCDKSHSPLVPFEIMIIHGDWLGTAKNWSI